MIDAFTGRLWKALSQGQSQGRLRQRLSVGLLHSVFPNLNDWTVRWLRCNSASRSILETPKAKPVVRHVCGDLGERGEDGEDVEANMCASVHYHQAHVECELVARIVQTTCMTNYCRLSIFEAFQSWSRRLVVQQT